jgi:uncharacterized repeat protein (TIGR01451 family)
VPEGAFGAFIGEDPNGTWTLTIVDTVPAVDEGTLHSWSLDITTAVCPADLSITKTASPDPVSPGGTLTYTLEVANTGTGAAKSVRVMDFLPGGTRFVSATASGGGWVVTAKPSPGGTGLVMFSNSNVGLATNATLTIVVRVNANVAPGTEITNTATIGSSISPGSTAPPTLELNLADNTSSATVTVQAPNPVAPGGDGAAPPSSGAGSQSR